MHVIPTPPHRINLIISGWSLASDVPSFVAIGREIVLSVQRVCVSRDAVCSDLVFPLPLLQVSVVRCASFRNTLPLTSRSLPLNHPLTTAMSSTWTLQEPLHEDDPEIKGMILREKDRQRKGLEMIASEVRRT